MKILTKNLACASKWHKLDIILHRKEEINTFSKMKNTEYDLTKLASMISTESSLKALLEMMGDMGLEMDSAVMGD